MPIEITDYRDEWPKRFGQEARRIRRALGPIAIRIEHVGSTAVPGLAAKDTVDIQISIDGFKPEARFKTPLEELGYVFRADDEPQHRQARRPSPHLCARTRPVARTPIELTTYARNFELPEDFRSTRPTPG